MAYYERLLEKEFQLYQELYGLRTHYCYIENTPAPFFNYVQRRRFFVLLFLYTIDYKVFVLPQFNSGFQFSMPESADRASFEQNLSTHYLDFLKDVTEWGPSEYNSGSAVVTKEGYLADTDSSVFSRVVANDDGRPSLRQYQCIYRLASGSVKIYETHETLLRAAVRIAHNKLKGSRIGDVQPVIHVKNHYVSTHGATRLHEGMGFLCRIEQYGNEFNKFHNPTSEELDGFMVDVGSVEPRLFPHLSERLCFEAGKALQQNKPLRHSDEELEANIGDSQVRQTVHRFIAKPLFNGLKSRAKESNGDIKAYIRSQVEALSFPSPLKYLDASCGDDDFILDLSSRLGRDTVFVGNDVSLPCLHKIQTKARQRRIDNVLFTNHSSVDLPYTSSYFNVSVCKNTLHHLRHYQEVRDTVTSLLSVTKDMVILTDVELPQASMHRAINLYYRHWLNDAGRNFLDFAGFQELFTEKEIKDLIEKKGMQVDFTIFHSLFGNIMVAKVTRLQEPVALVPS